MPADYSIPLQIQTPNPMATLGNLVDTARGIQGYQSGQIQQQRLGISLQSEQQANQERQNVINAIQAKDPDLMPGPDGIVDQARATPKLQQLAPQTHQAYLQNIAQSNQSNIKTNSDIESLGQQGTKDLGEVMQSTVGRPLSDKVDAVKDWMTRAGNTPQVQRIGDQFVTRLNTAKPKKDGGDDGDSLAIVAAKRANAIGDQITASQAGIGTADVGQKIQPFVTQSNLSGLPVGSPVGSGLQKTLPPSTPVMQGTTPGYLGATGGTNKGFVASGLPVGQEANIGGTVAAVNDDWKSTLAEASKSAQDIGVLQNIKQYARGAITGVGSDRANLLAGLAGHLNMTSAELAKTNTDMLAKNSAMLALAGGDTNLAKTLAESANPNTHMTPEAIEHAADQVSAQRQMPAIKQQYMGQFKNDPQQYTAQLARWNAVADPRILQWPTMNAKEKADMKASMSPLERSKFSAKMRAFEGMVGPVQ